MLRSLLFAPGAALALAFPTFAQTTWTVDDDGSADFVAPQHAVNAASDGDTILVRAGFYSATTVDGKSLTIIGEGAPQLVPSFFAAPALTVRNLAKGQQVLFRGFELGGAAFAEQTTVFVEDNAGPVLFEDVLIAGVGTPISIRDSVSVTLSDCTLTAPATFANFVIFGGFVGFAPYVGLGATDSNVFLYDCAVSGSSGGASFEEFGTVVPPAPSQIGVSLVGSTLLASGCTFTGGSGGSGGGGLCFPGEDGSPALSLSGSSQNPTSTARLLDTTLVAGTGGTGSCGEADGLDAAATEVNAGTIETVPGAARSFAGSAPTPEGSSVEIALAGEPGDVVILHVQLEAAPGLFLSPYNIALHMPLPTAVVGLGALPGSGSLALSFPVPNLANGLESMRFVGQALFVNGAAQVFDGGPSIVLITDSAL